MLLNQSNLSFDSFNIVANTYAQIKKCIFRYLFVSGFNLSASLRTLTLPCNMYCLCENVLLTVLELFKFNVFKS